MAEQRHPPTECNRAVDTLRAFYGLARLISSSLNTQEVFDFVVRSAAKLVNAKMVRLWVEDQSAGGFVVQAVYGIDSQILREHTLVPIIRPGEGVIGRIIETKAAEYIPDVREESRWLNKHLTSALGLISFAGVPIVMGDRVLGVLTIMADRVREFSREEKDLANVFADQAAVAIENARLFEETRCNLERVRALREIDQTITSTLDLCTVLNVLLEKVGLLLPYSAVTVRLFNKESGLLEPGGCRNLNEAEWKAEEWRSGRGIPNVVFETKSPVIIRNVQTDPRCRDIEFFRRHALVSYLGVPLIVKDENLGVISFYTKDEHEFSNEEVEFLCTLAGQVSIAIHNAQLYQEMAKLAANLMKSNKVKDEFLSVMSHELRTPMSVVMGYAEMVRDGMLGEINPKQEEALDKIMSRARDQLTIINNILQATYLETGEVKVESHEFSTVHFLGDLRSHYQIPLGKGLSLYWDYPSDLPMVKADSGKLKYILQSLIDNAIKFTERGWIKISARCLDSKLTEFKVADTGIGIAEEYLPVIFEKFRQVDGSQTRAYGGVGLGLYIVKKLTEVLGGKVEVESELGKGSTFRVTIPCESCPSTVNQHRVMTENPRLPRLGEADLVLNEKGLS